MAVPAPSAAVVALALVVRQRLADLGRPLSPALSPARRRDRINDAARERALALAARQFASVVVTAAAPFAPTAYARTRLLRQMYASGLLTADEVRRTSAVLEIGTGEDDGGQSARGSGTVAVALVDLGASG